MRHNFVAYKYYQIGGLHEGYVIAKNVLDAQKKLMKRYGSIDDFEITWSSGVSVDLENNFVIEI